MLRLHPAFGPCLGSHTMGAATRDFLLSSQSRVKIPPHPFPSVLSDVFSPLPNKPAPFIPGSARDRTVAGRGRRRAEVPLSMEAEGEGGQEGRGLGFLPDS